MKKSAIGIIAVLTTVLAACAPSATTTAPTTTTGPTTAVRTTTAPTTKPVEKPQYGGTLNLVLISDITDWSQGLTFC